MHVTNAPNLANSFCAQKKEAAGRFLGEVCVVYKRAGNAFSSPSMHVQDDCFVACSWCCARWALYGKAKKTTMVLIRVGGAVQRIAAWLQQLACMKTRNRMCFCRCDFLQLLRPCHTFVLERNTKAFRTTRANLVVNGEHANNLAMH